MWVRGLKLVVAYLLWIEYLVAPYVGAWIETRKKPVQHHYQLSHPMWVRGLKQSLTL